MLDGCAPRTSADASDGRSYFVDGQSGRDDAAGVTESTPWRTLKRIQRAGGRDRVGLFTLAKREPVRRDEQDFVEDRGTAYGAGRLHPAG